MAFITPLYAVSLRLLHFVQSGRQTKSAQKTWINKLLTALVALLSLSSVNSLNNWVWLEGLFSETMTLINTSCPTGSRVTAHPVWQRKQTARCVRLGWKSRRCCPINAHNIMLENASRTRSLLWNYSGNDSLSLRCSGKSLSICRRGTQLAPLRGVTLLMQLLANKQHCRTIIIQVC